MKTYSICPSLSDILSMIISSGICVAANFILYCDWVLFHCVHVPHLFYPLICLWTFRLLPLEKAVAPHSSTPAWKIPWMEEPGGLQSMGLLSVRHDLSDFTFTFHFHALEKEMATHSSVLAWKIPGTGEPGGLPSMGSHRVGHDWSDLAAAAAVGCFHVLAIVTISSFVLFLLYSFHC